MTDGKSRDDAKAAAAGAGEAATSLVVTAGPVYAATGSAAAAALAGLFGVLPQVVGTVIPGFLNLQQRRVDKWWRSVLKDEGDRNFEQELYERIAKNDEAVLATLMASLRALLDHLDGATVVPLARLTKEYAKPGRAPDLFFRGMADVLSRIQSHELSTLRVIARLAAEIPALDEPDAFVKLLQRARDGSPRPAADARWVGYHKRVEKKVEFVPLLQLPHVREVFALLKAARLADDFRGGFGETAGPDDLLVEREVGARIARLVAAEDGSGTDG